MSKRAAVKATNKADGRARAVIVAICCRTNLVNHSPVLPVLIDAFPDERHDLPAIGVVMGEVGNGLQFAVGTGSMFVRRGGLHALLQIGATDSIGKVLGLGLPGTSGEQRKAEATGHEQTGQGQGQGPTEPTR